MGRSRRRRPRRWRVGRISYYEHHGSWWLYYREGAKQVRRRVADTEAAAALLAAQLNAQLASGASGQPPAPPAVLPAVPPVLPPIFEPISVPDIRQRFLGWHEHVVRSSLATVHRYRTATKYLEDFVGSHGSSHAAHEVDVEAFVCWLRSQRIAPNGHANSPRRALRDKGLRFILEVCRSMFAYAAKKRHLPPYTENPFSAIGLERLKIEDAKPVFVFDEETELAFLQAADDWAFPVHFTLAKTGLRPGELNHLLIEDVDLERGWLHVRNKPELGWRIKTGRERSVPLIEELVLVLRRIIAGRSSGPVFVRRRFEPAHSPLRAFDRGSLARACHERLEAAEAESGDLLSRERQARLIRTVWRDAGALRPDAARKSFVRLTRALSLPQVTCPKSWRHSFATCLQDANVDPLIRQQTLGHQPARDAQGALGMTTTYTHTRPQTQREQIEGALRRWPRSLELAAAWAAGCASSDPGA